MDASALASEAVTFTVDTLDVLVTMLRDDGYRVVAPVVRDGAIVHGEVQSVADLPRGWTDEQEPGLYRLRRRDDDALFGYAVGPSSPRGELFPTRQHLWSAQLGDDGTVTVADAPVETGPTAFLGVRGCELAAISIQDRVFLGGLVEDRVYAARRQDVLLVAVECGSPSGTCFCVSMGTGPAVDDGADLVLTELFDGGHRFLARPGTAAGRAVLARLPVAPSRPDDDDERAAVLAHARASMGRELDTDDIHDLLLGNLEHPRWDDVASRCLACGNCTLVCPTCFCTEVEDTTDLTGTVAEHDRRWASCFEALFSHSGPGSVRTTTRARYRQWMTHKLATWIDQFDSSGCVGCGRCLTWCPVGIDITAETAAIRATDQRRPAAPDPAA